MLIITIELILAVTCFLTCLHGEYQERTHTWNRSGPLRNLPASRILTEFGCKYLVSYFTGFLFLMKWHLRKISKIFLFKILIAYDFPLYGKSVIDLNTPIIENAKNESTLPRETKQQTKNKAAPCEGTFWHSSLANPNSHSKERILCSALQEERWDPPDWWPLRSRGFASEAMSRTSCEADIVPGSMLQA